MNEVVGRRILGAFRCLDAITGNPVETPLAVTTGRLAIRPNRSGVFVIFGGEGFGDLTADAIRPGIAWPAPQPFEVSIQDARLAYLPRRALVQVPQATSADDAKSMQQAQGVRLYRGPAARVEPNWAVIHASVVKAGPAPQPGLPWAALRVTRAADHAVIATALADARGEALLAVPGLAVQVSSSGGGSVLQSSVPVTVDALFDPAAANRPAPWIPNPDDILSNPAGPWKTASHSLALSAGQTLNLSFEISV